MDNGNLEPDSTAGCSGSLEIFGLDSRRAAKVRGTPEDLDAALNVADSDGRPITENRLMLASVIEAMSGLTRDQQVLVALVCVEGLTYPEAAEVLGIPVGTVMSRLARARKAIGMAMLDKAKAKRPDAEGCNGGKHS